MKFTSLSRNKIILTGETLAGEEAGVAVEGGRRWTRDFAGMVPQSEQVDNFVEKKISDGDERNPEEGIDFPLSVVSEEFSQIIITFRTHFVLLFLGVSLVSSEAVCVI